MTAGVRGRGQGPAAGWHILSRYRHHLFRATIVLALLGGAAAIYAGASARLAARGVGTGFGFLLQEAGFAIGETLPILLPSDAGGWAFVALLLAAAGGLAMPLLAGGTAARRGAALGFLALLGAGGMAALGVAGVALVEYSPERSFAFALSAGFANTVKAGLFGCVIATAAGVLVGIARLSSNWLLARAATAFVETLRNIPLLVLVLFWYFGVLRALPAVRQSLDIGGTVVLNNRGVFLPDIHATGGTWPVILALLAGTGLAVMTYRRAIAAKMATGALPGWWAAVPLLPVAAPALAWALSGAPATFSYPVLSGFNYVGGLRLSPEFAALLLGLGLYHAAFIAEIVRAGLQGVDPGQRQAALALGFREGRILRLIVFPQALRVMFPPLITQYLSLIKDSSLGFAIAYPELVTLNNVIINQTGQPIEVLLITISVFMAFNLMVSFILNRFERRYAWSWA
ncbi:MAG: ABC transporter permease subunit [Rhodobacteraceae bacterium]|jgi:general L-amino acid transport system permease protein|nr:ABC transporter permease subunit [Paracoccaceae bacterium]